jgi:hypothetical protein
MHGSDVAAAVSAFMACKNTSIEYWITRVNSLTYFAGIITHFCTELTHLIFVIRVPDEKQLC